MNDGRLRPDSSSADKVKQSRAKNDLSQLMKFGHTRIIDVYKESLPALYLSHVIIKWYSSPVGAHGMFYILSPKEVRVVGNIGLFQSKSKYMCACDAKFGSSGMSISLEFLTCRQSSLMRKTSKFDISRHFGFPSSYLASVPYTFALAWLQQDF